jgi:ribose transport system substrate-binding protein
MTVGAYNVIEASPAYENVYVAAAADGQKEALALIEEGGCDGRYISTGLNSPSLAADEALQIAVDIATGKKEPRDYPAESFTLAVGIGCENVDEHYDPESVF